MIKFLGIFINIFLLVLVFLQIPEENMGLTSVTNGNSTFGSSQSTQRFLQTITLIAVCVYFIIAILENLTF